MPTEQPRWTAFRAERCLAAGSPQDVVTAIKSEAAHGQLAGLLVFDDATGKLVDLDLRGSLQACLARLPSAQQDAGSSAPARGPGRPKLGVVAREVTLLPRHWEWLGEQPGGASVALRKLVEAARTAQAPQDRKRRAREASDRFMQAMAGNRPGYEEAARALYAGDRPAFVARTRTWPADIRSHARRLARAAFEE